VQGAVAPAQTLHGEERWLASVMLPARPEQLQLSSTIRGFWELNFRQVNLTLDYFLIQVKGPDTTAALHWCC